MAQPLLKKMILIAAMPFFMGAWGCATKPGIGCLPVAPEYTAEQILNKDLLHRKPSPPPSPVAYDETGFAKERLYSVPKPGVHPRLFFGPDDLPRIRRQLQETEAGRQALAYVREVLAKSINQPGTWEYSLADALERSDLDSFGRLYRPDAANTTSAPGRAAFIPETAKPASKWHHRDVFTVNLMLAAFVALLDDDRAAGARIGKILAAYTRWLEPQVEAVNRGMFGHSYWRAGRRVVGERAEFAYAYDWAHPFMTPAERDQVRRVISKITTGNYAIGMDLPAHWRNWNWIPIGHYFTLISLAIEGEEGYDPRIYARSVEVLRDFISYGFNAQGTSDESVGYTTAGTTHLSAVMLAMANRGDNLFTHSHYRRLHDQWMLWTLQPYGREWLTDGDVATAPPGLEPLMVAKFFYPGDAKLDFVYQNIPAVAANNYRTDYFMELLLLCPADPARAPDGRLVDYRDGRAFNLPNSSVDDARGVLITRSDWSKDALYLNFQCHPDTFMANHDHADRGRFVLSALGRNWAREDGRLTETSEHSSVLIDGVGQGKFAPAGKWLGCTDTPAATFAACDAAYCYDWKWHKQIMTWSPDDPRLQSPYYAAYRDQVGKLGHWESDPSPQVAAYFKGYLDGNPLMWCEDSWVVRTPHNPVRRAFRTAGLVRGLQPFALVMDDIQKDAAEHLYQWLLAVPADITLASQSEKDGVLDLVLGEKHGDRRLLVRVLAATNLPGSPTAKLESYDAKNSSSLAVPSKRLVVSSRSVTPGFKVMLVPHRAGDPLPSTTWNADRTQLTVRSGNQLDTFDFRLDPAGRTLVRTTRATPGADKP